MWVKKRHRVTFEIVRPFLKLYFRMFYKCKIKTHKLPKEGSIIISNHSTTMDPFLIGTSFNKQLYYMVSVDLLEHKVIGKLFKFFVNPIPKAKSNKNDIEAIKACIKVAKENGNICIFPEGNRTFSGKLGNIDYSIVKLIKKLKKPLILCNIIGGYPTDPRWSNKLRKGKMEVKIKNTYSVEEIEKMDNDELYQIILDNLTVDDYHLGVKFKGKNKAEDLERILYICPVCHQKNTIYTKGDFIFCSSCGLEVKYNEDVTLSSSNDSFSFKYVSQWYDYQIEEVKNSKIEDELIYQDEIEVYAPRLYKSKELIGKGKMSLYKNRFVFNLEDKELVFSFSKIDGITLLGKKKMNIYYEGKTYQVYKDRKTNLLKYMHMYYILKNKEEGVEDGFIGI